MERKNIRKHLGFAASAVVGVSIGVLGAYASLSHASKAEASRLPVPRENQALVVYQNTPDRVNYAVLTDFDGNYRWDYAVEVDDVKNGDRTKIEYVDRTIKFGGPVGSGTVFVDPNFFNKYNKYLKR